MVVRAGAGAPRPHPLTIIRIRMIAVRNRNPQMTAWTQIRMTCLSRREPFGRREMFPYVFRENRREGIFVEECFPVRRVEEIQIFNLGWNPTRLKHIRTPHHNSEGRIGGDFSTKVSSP